MPADGSDLFDSAKEVLNKKRSTYIKIGMNSKWSRSDEDIVLRISKYRILVTGKEGAIIGIGPVLKNGLEAAKDCL